MRVSDQSPLILFIMDTVYSGMFETEHVHCWHSKIAGHITVDKCCRCGKERRAGGWTRYGPPMCFTNPHEKGRLGIKMGQMTISC